MWQKHVPGLDQRTDRRGAPDLSPLRIHGQDSSNLTAQHLNHRGTVRFVLDQLRRAATPLGRQLTHGLHRRGAVHARAHLIQQQEIATQSPPDLADHIVRRLQILERAIPGLRQLFDVPDFVSNDQPLAAIREPYRNWRKVGGNFGSLCVCGVVIAVTRNPARFEGALAPPSTAREL